MSFGSAARTFEMVEPTGAGRSYTARRRVRLGDATPNGRLRLDAVARYLQDVANDDGRDADWSDPHWWVVRRTVIDVRTFPVYLQEVDLTTWCGGVGSHWAERRTRITSMRRVARPAAPETASTSAGARSAFADRFAFWRGSSAWANRR